METRRRKLNTLQPDSVHTPQEEKKDKTRSKIQRFIEKLVWILLAVAVDHYLLFFKHLFQYTNRYRLSFYVIQEYPSMLQ